MLSFQPLEADFFIKYGFLGPEREQDGVTLLN